MRRLTEEDGGELQVHGSAGLVQTLLENDLVDELRVVVAPVTVGAGKRLFGEGTTPRTWRLTASSVTSTGMLMCSYQRAGELVTGEYTLEDEHVTASGSGTPLDRLTDRQREVAELVAQGLSNDEIADRLYLSLATVKSHVTAVMRRLDVRPRTQLAILVTRGPFPAA